ncbi:hypothetical protein O6H91_18G025000 [Diphasiastrum complanatum]|uniref:Uncharacterized protein n=1 Tax=Diphasiastrum complanatum TaxID=34168 RepID=A0ACC2AZ02_DIPCM|nr:hypothetical protein O6H91_18G025000 [Diphasiastrum complanatum]
MDACEVKENCGICLTSISNRGVLDCCDHSFCSSCIDGWASITNLCPSCKSVFKLITFLPVGSDDLHQPEPTDLENGSKGWDAELDYFNESLPFTFPSFYIDEEAVECLQGGECLVHCGQTAFNSWNDLADTSVACDSCDCWYHAICVGFDPRKSEGAWLCPRWCSPEKFSWRSMSADSHVETKVLPSARPLLLANFIPEAVNSDVEELNKGLPISVSMPELGETAIVVSMVMESTKQSDEQANPSVKEEFLVSLSNDLPLQNMSFSNSECEHPADSKDGDKAHESRVSQEQSELELYKEMGVEVKDSNQTKEFETGSLLPTDGCNNFLAPEDHSSCGNKNSQISELDTSCTITNLQASENVSSSLSIPNECDDKDKRKLKRKTFKMDSSIMDIVRADGLPNKSQNTARKVRSKEGPALCSGQVHGQAPMAKENHSNSVKYSQKSELAGTAEHRHASFSPRKMELFEATNILTEGSKPQSSIIEVAGSAASGTGLDKENGVRTRTIMWRTNEDNGKISSLVEEVRQRMRATVGYGASTEPGLIDVSNEKFLSAFKNALAKNSQQNKKAGGTLRCRKLGSLKRAGVRETLTKKLYGGGRGSRVWDRDWEISFWRERVRRSAKDTTQRNSAANKEIEEFESILSSLTKVKETESLLGRLYVADTSLLPRGDNIQPLSEKLECQSSDHQKPQTSEGRPRDNVQNQQQNIVRSNQSSMISMSQVTAATLSGGNQSSQKPTHTQSSHATVQAATNTGSKMTTNVPKEKASNTHMSDKQKWALEVLARKKGEKALPVVHDRKRGSSSVGDKNFLLLAQLPSDMRPVLEHNFRSRIPTAVRQAHLNRLVEYQLKRARLPIIERNKESQAAVAAAVLKEKDIYERSNSRIVYTNLCVQSLNQQMDVTATEKLENIVSKALKSCIDDAVNAALLAAGLVSDSPPGSPSISANWRTDEDITCSQSDTNGCHPDSNQDLHIPSFCDPSLDIYKDIEFEFDACEPHLQVSQEKRDSSEICGPSDLDNSRLRIRLSSTNGNTLATSCSPIEGPSKNLAVSCTSEKDVDLQQDPGAMQKGLSITESTIHTISGASPAHSCHLDSRKSYSESTTIHEEPVVSHCQDSSAVPSACGNYDQRFISSKDFSEETPVKLVSQSVCPSDVIAISDVKMDREKDLEAGVMQDDINTSKSCIHTVSVSSSVLSSHLGSRMSNTKGTPVDEEPIVPHCQDLSAVLSACGKNDDESQRFITSKEILESPIELVSQSVCSLGAIAVSDVNVDKEKCLEAFDINSTFLSAKDNLIEDQVSNPGESMGPVKDGFFQPKVFLPECEKKSPDSELSRGHNETMSVLQQCSTPEPQITAGFSNDPAKIIPTVNELRFSIHKKVEMYVKEHIKPLYKSGVVTVEQYQWALMKTTKKVLQHHSNSTSADFLITEGGKVKKLAEQYLQIFLQRNSTH